MQESAWLCKYAKHYLQMMDIQEEILLKDQDFKEMLDDIDC